MQLSYLLASLLASGEVIADHTNASNLNISEITLSMPPNIPPASSLPEITLADGTVIEIAENSCWTDPIAPPIASTSSEYAKGTCNVCVSQSLLDVESLITTSTLQDYRVQIRDDTNHDMGAVNRTLAALGGETGDKETNITMTVGGKPFHLWTMRDPVRPLFAVVYMDYDGPGPSDPSVQPPMVFDAAPADGTVTYVACTQSNIFLRDGKRVYFQCSFQC